MRKERSFNSKTRLIKTPVSKGRRFAVGDIHGCSKTFRLLIQQLELNQSDQLFLLGDFIDEGPDSKGVLDYIFELQKQFQVFPLMGNHEEMLLECWEDYNPRVFDKLLRLNKARDLADNEAKLKPEYESFLYNLPHCYDLGDFYLVHAGFDFSQADLFEKTRKLLWSRTKYFSNHDISRLNGRKVIHGHTPESILKIRQQVEIQDTFICLDNGCYAKNKHRRTFKAGELGRLCALELNTFTLFEQEYAEG